MGDAGSCAAHVPAAALSDVYRRTPELGADLLNGAEALTSWLDRARLLPQTDHPATTGHSGSVFADTAIALDQARELRALLWMGFDAQKDGRPIPADVLAGLLDTGRRGITSIVVHSDGAMTPLAADGVFTILALHALALVLGPPPQGVRACDRCGWFFIDSSRGRRRRWCSMKTCGNQAKAARYRSTRPS